MSRGKKTALENNFSEAIKQLQARLKETQEGMARRIGCTLGAYVKWRRGERLPSAEWLVRILNVCPDEGTREAFGVDPRNPANTQKAIKEDWKMHIKNPKNADRYRRLENDFREVMKSIEAGDNVARERLNAMLELYIRAAGIESDPTIPKARRKKALDQILRIISSQRSKKTLGT